mgnify:CR=1 FL=1
MPKWLDRSLGAVSILMQSAIALVGIMMVVYPIVFLVMIFHDNFVKADIVNDTDFLIVSGHTHVATSAINHFPSFLYGGLMVIGVILTCAAVIVAFTAIVEIISNLGHQKYFIPENVQMLRRLVRAQVIFLVADPFLAIANGMTSSILGRVNTGMFNGTWEDFFSDILLCIFLLLIYYLFKAAFNIKRENDLTV